ncbi:MAG: hypothetical protein KF687_16275 [Cyclobacteriaceae bacterium]|nr:hypothetical protein [Cyclobacteriaceae bacterium]
MKKIVLIILIMATVLTSCTDFELGDLGFDIKPIGSYVAFANAGGTVTPIVRNISESTTAVQNLRIECATGTLSDITVTYSFSGSAVFGTDFSVVTPGGSATAAGGTILLKRKTDPDGVNDFDFVNLGVQALTDGVADGDKTLVITLVSAVNADGKEFSVGRGAEGGTIYLRTATINIEDVD